MVIWGAAGGIAVSSLDRKLLYTMKFLLRVLLWIPILCRPY